MDNLKRLTREEKVVELNKVKKKKKLSPGYFFVAPWFISYFLFSLVPMLLSIYMSFTNWPVIGKPQFIGLQNFKDIFQDEAFFNSLIVTVKYAIVAVPLGMAASFTVALIMSSKTKGLNLYRTIYYLPAVVSGVAVGIIWRWIFDPKNGLINNLLALVGITGPGWLTDPNWVLPSYIIMSLWGAGAGMLTYLVSINEVPKDLHEAAEIQGANYFKRIFLITIPYVRSILYYNLIMGIIGAFKKFNDAYILGGAGNQGQFILLQIYDTAFKYFKMGYASAMSWIFLLIVLSITLVVFKFTDFWQYSQNNEEK
ncbi:carbohydrate ABC transporter permease [Vagococcus teuberi]|uniref:ABC transporter permease n=1 Tax=Vagococcus teuberi TaxID=519472 RepID=A0A1J0A409_9ENTE|nr:sugar ABC transporter permease [Vagococcus teuberi]APB30662.1 ABC transporter permease [Vagococcus teuberi]